MAVPVMDVRGVGVGVNQPLVDVEVGVGGLGHRVLRVGMQVVTVVMAVEVFMGQFLV